MNVLVTGGAGYIGSVVAHQLLQAGHTVVVYDDLSHGKRRGVPPRATFLRAALVDQRALVGALREHRIDAVMHFAALIEAGESMQVPEQYFRNNTTGTLSLLEAMLASDVRRLVFSSTAALYGEPERIPVQEDDPLRPTNAYGESKLLSERMLRWFHQLHGFRYSSLRYFNASGAAGDFGEDHRPESHLIPLILKVALGQRATISVFGRDYPTADGTCIRDYIHVLDLATAHVLALDALGRRTEPLIYNLGNGHGFSVLEVIEAARRVTGQAIAVSEAPRRAGDPAVLVASSEKIRRELDWQPKHADLDEIVRSAWEWMRRFPNGYPD